MYSETLVQTPTKGQVLGHIDICSVKAKDIELFGCLVRAFVEVCRTHREYDTGTFWDQRCIQHGVFRCHPEGTDERRAITDTENIWFSMPAQRPT